MSVRYADVWVSVLSSQAETSERKDFRNLTTVREIVKRDETLIGKCADSKVS